MSSYGSRHVRCMPSDAKYDHAIGHRSSQAAKSVVLQASRPDLRGYDVDPERRANCLARLRADAPTAVAADALNQQDVQDADDGQRHSVADEEECRVVNPAVV